jgi:predicted RNase H-like nuclease (RuvC/YqgF family)
LDVEATRKAMAAANVRKLAEARGLLKQAQQEEQESEARLKRVKRDYFNDDLTAAEWREAREELEPELEAAKAEMQSLKERLEEAEAGIALAEFQGEVLKALSEVRGALAKEVADAEGSAATRAVLMRLFDGFVLHREGSGRQEHLELVGGDWIEPVVSEHAVSGYKEGLQPVLAHTHLGPGAQKNSGPGYPVQHLFGPISLGNK